MLTEKSHHTISEFKENADDICRQVLDGAVVTLVKNHVPFAELRGVNDGGLPEDRKYTFVALRDLKTADGLKQVSRIFEQGNSVIVKDYTAPKRAISGTPKANIVVMTPAVK